MDCVTAKLALEVAVRLEQEDGNPLTSQEERQDGPRRPSPHDAAVGTLHLTNIVDRTRAVAMPGGSSHVDGFSTPSVYQSRPGESNGDG